MHDSDKLILFNLAIPLPHFPNVPAEQMVLMVRWYNQSHLSATKQLHSLAPSFDKVVFVAGNLAEYTINNPHQILPLPHFEAFNWQSRFLDQVLSSYPNSYKTAGTWNHLPSTGFIGFRYAQKYFSMHRIVMVGFTGQGKPIHNFTFEQEVYKTAGIRQM